MIIHTRSQGLINKILVENINRPSLVTSNHIDIIYQIRQMLSDIPFHVDFTNTHAAPKEVNIKPTTNLKSKKLLDPKPPPTLDEKNSRSP